METSNTNIALWGIVGLIIVPGLFFGFPAFGRYQTLLNAQNELAAQQYLKQVAIATAESKNESAKFEAQAEVTRAEGVAKANAIIGDSLKGNEAYLKYLWINNMNDQAKEVIYVPTEANLPILEAGKR
jgi:hypothetical protein